MKIYIKFLLLIIFNNTHSTNTKLHLIHQMDSNYTKIQELLKSSKELLKSPKKEEYKKEFEENLKMIIEINAPENIFLQFKLDFSDLIIEKQKLEFDFLTLIDTCKISFLTIDVNNYDVIIATQNEVINNFEKEFINYKEQFELLETKHNELNEKIKIKHNELSFLSLQQQ
jgi:hypothetical protein